jgi:hypothetical protein
MEAGSKGPVLVHCGNTVRAGGISCLMKQLLCQNGGEEAYIASPSQLKFEIMFSD